MFDQTKAWQQVNTNVNWSQISESGKNKYDNCVVAIFSDIMWLYYKFHTQPQWWTSGEYGPNYVGPTSYAKAVDWMQKNPEDFPNPPEVRISNPVDTLAAIDGAGKAGFAIAFNGWSDSSAVFQTHRTGILHVGAVQKLDGSSITVLNPWLNKIHTYNYADFKNITYGAEAGWLAIFARPIPQAVVPNPVIQAIPLPIIKPPDKLAQAKALAAQIVAL